jgi:hypothetical protein
VDLGSTEHGFPVFRVTVSTGSGSGNSGAPSLLLNADQRGEDRLFVYQGIGDLDLDVGQVLDFRVPGEAFAHTNKNAIVNLDAYLVDGSPLPEWLDFDPISGRFAGKLPTGAPDTLEIKVIARDNEGRETSTTFIIHIRSEKISPANQRGAADGTDGSAHHADAASALAAAKLAAAKAPEKPAAARSFRDQLADAKRGSASPFIVRIAPKDPKDPGKTG